MKILLLGSGAREHALARALARDPQTSELIVAPGNPGTSAIATNLNIDPSVPEEVVALATQMKADLVVVGPEAPLVAGVADAVRDHYKPQGPADTVPTAPLTVHLSAGVKAALTWPSLRV